MAHLLIAEDDELLRDGLRTIFTQAGHEVSTCVDGALAWAAIQTEAFDAVVLDLGLPQLDGFQVLARLRQRWPTLPVLILTARDGVEDRVAGLNAGADDYLTKPFNLDELLARVQAMLRRANLPAHANPATPVATDGLRIDTDMPRAWIGPTAIDLTQREWELLRLLWTHLGQVVSREAVLAAWQTPDGDNAPLASNALEVYVHRLRRKLGDAPLNIRNVRGLGYLLETTGHG
jgi:DNA-binding response OmpR family regulator